MRLMALPGAAEEQPKSRSTHAPDGSLYAGSDRAPRGGCGCAATAVASTGCAQARRRRCRSRRRHRSQRRCRWCHGDAAGPDGAQRPAAAHGRKSRGAGSPVAPLRAGGTMPPRAARPTRGGLCRHTRRIGRRCACIWPAALPSEAKLTSCSTWRAMVVIQSVATSRAAAGSGRRACCRGAGPHSRPPVQVSAGAQCANVQAAGPAEGLGHRGRQEGKPPRSPRWGPGARVGAPEPAARPRAAASEAPSRILPLPCAAPRCVRPAAAPT